MSDTKLIVPQTYRELRRSVEAVIVKGRRSIEQAWIKSYHETGRLIHEHALLKKERAAYGAEIFRRLASDTGVDIRTLQQMVQFYRLFPIARHGAQLSWAHYRVLIQVEDKTTRDNLLRETLKNGWASPQLIERVRQLNSLLTDSAEANSDHAATPPKLLTPKRGTPGVCKVIAVDGGLVVDLGFACYLDLPGDTGFRAGEFVGVSKAGISPEKDATKADLFTYRAVVQKVVD